MVDYGKIDKLLDCEMEKIAAKPELNDASLSNLYKLVDVKKDLTEIAAKELEMETMLDGGNSNRYYNNGSSYYAGNSYRRGGGGGRSYARGTSRRNYGYSMDDGVDDEMLEHLENAMRRAGSEQEREAFRKAIMKLEN